MKSSTTLDPEVKRALLAYLDALALAEPFQTQLWESAGLTLAQLAVLRQLRQGSLSASRLAQAIGRSSASVTRLLDRLEERNMVSRHRDGEDRRCVEVRLEDEGLRAMGEVRPLSDTPLGRAISRMSDNELESLEANLRLLVERTREQAGEVEEVKQR